MSREATKNIDYITKDYEGFRSLMLNQLGILMPEYTDRSQTDAGIVLLELFSMGLDILSYYQDSIANECYLSTAQLRSSLTKWCYMLDYYPRNSTPAKFKQVFTLSKKQDEEYIIPEGTVVKTQGTIDESIVYYETTEDLIIPAGKLGNEQDSKGDYLYSVNIIEGLSIHDELLGSSTGARNQSFMLKYTPVIADSIEVYVNEGNGFRKWDKVDNFIDSNPQSPHFIVTLNEKDEAIITFGDGNFGKIPDIYTNGIYCDYRTGGGTSGNVGANKIVVLDSPLALIDSTFNPEAPYEYGHNKETLEEIRMNAPNAYRTKWGALTYDDFGDITVLKIPEVLEAVSTGEGYDVEIYIMLREGKLTPDIIKRVDHLFSEQGEGRKIVSAGKITPHDPTEVGQTIAANLIVEGTFNKGKVEKEVKEFITEFFKYGNYSFNTPLSYSKLSRDIMNNIEGIRSFNVTSPTEEVLIPKIGEVYTLTQLTLTTTGGVSDD